VRYRKNPDPVDVLIKALLAVVAGVLILALLFLAGRISAGG